MSDITIFLTADSLTEQMPINNDSDSDNLSKTIYIAQEQHIQSSLGSKLYKHIKGLVQAATIGNPGNVNYKILLDEHIIEVLLRYAYYRAIRTQSTQVTDKGAQNRRGEASERAEESNVHALRQDALKDAQFHEKLMLKFICEEGAAVFPEYFNSDSDDLKPKPRVPFNGIVYPESRAVKEARRFS